METVDILADILNKKPGLSLDFVYCINKEKVSDTLAYILSLKDYARSGKISGANSTTFPDSILSKYLLGKLPPDSLLVGASLNKLCRNYIGADKLNNKIDSLKSTQTSFLQNYLSRDKEIPIDRFRIIVTMPDSIKYREPVPSFRTYFTAAEQKQD